MNEIKLPDEVTIASNPNPRDLVIISIPKMGKGTILGKFTEEYNALILDLEKGGYEYINARKLSTYENQDSTFLDSFGKYIEFRNTLIKNKGKYDYLIIDGLSDLDALSEYGGTLLYMNSIVGKKFNRNDKNEVYKYSDAEWKSVLSLPDGNGYQWTRKWFLEQIELFRQISPYRIYAAHTADKYIKDNGREEVVGSEIALAGKLKVMFASKVTSLAKLTSEGNKRYLNFEVLNDSILAGSRAPNLSGKILISEKLKDGKVVTYWNNIYK